MHWHLEIDGHRYTVRSGAGRRETELLVDDQHVESVTPDYWSKATFETEPGRIVVEWGPRNLIDTVRLHPADGGQVLDFVPPAGSRAARREALRRDHPVRFTLQRVAIAVAEIAIGVLGLSALVAGLIPRIDLSWLPSLPEIDPPDWLRFVDPLYWLSKVPWPDLPDLPNLLAWVPDWVGDSAPYWVPILIAVAVAQGEIQRRRSQDRRREADPAGADRDPADDEDPDHCDEPGDETGR